MSKHEKYFFSSKKNCGLAEILRKFVSFVPTEDNISKVQITKLQNFETAVLQKNILGFVTVMAVLFQTTKKNINQQRRLVP